MAGRARAHPADQSSATNATMIDIAAGLMLELALRADRAGRA